MNKTYCDICEKEINEYAAAWHLKLEPRKIGELSIQKHDVCEDCINKIKKLIQDLGVRK